MAWEQRDNSGILFVNDRKTKDGQPDRQGDAMIDGVMYRMSGWVKTGNKGPFMTMSFTKKDMDAAAPAKAAARDKPDDDWQDSSVPF